MQAAAASISSLERALPQIAWQLISPPRLRAAAASICMGAGIDSEHVLNTEATGVSSIDSDKLPSADPVAAY